MKTPYSLSTNTLISPVEASGRQISVQEHEYKSTQNPNVKPISLYNTIFQGTVTVLGSFRHPVLPKVRNLQKSAMSGTYCLGNQRFTGFMGCQMPSAAACVMLF